MLLSPSPSPIGKTFKVLCHVDLGIKAARERLIGLMRFCSQHPEINIVHINDAWNPDRTLNDIDAVVISMDESEPIKRNIHRRTKVFSCEMSGVRMDIAAVAHAAADLLIRRGYRHFAYVGSHLKDERHRSLLRAQHFSDYIRSQGFDCTIYHASRNDSLRTNDEVFRLAKFLRTLSKPCGIMLYADNCVLDVLYACQCAHITVPDQIGLVGVDNDTFICENVRPTLSSVWPDFEKAGFLLGEIVLATLKGEIAKSAIPPYGVRAVIERDSSLDPNCGGRLVCRIDNYLKENLDHDLTLGELSRQFNVSGRLIEMRFRKIRGYTLRERINSLRIEKAKHLLHTSTFPVNEVASACGYGSDRAFRYAFAASTGMSARQYRQSSFKKQ